jgi:chromosome segregation ATPase
MGFADDVQDAIKAVAKINLTQLEMEKFNKLAEAFKNLLGIAKIKNEFTETLSDNRVIVVMSEDEEWVGKQVFLETGEPLEDGSHALMSGKTITVAGGIITEVAAATPEDKPNEEMENKIKELESQLAAAKAEQQAAVEAKASLEKEVATAKAETTKIQNRVTDIEKKFLELQEEMSKTVGQKPVIKPGPVIKNVNQNIDTDPMGEFALKELKNRHLIKDED